MSRPVHTRLPPRDQCYDALRSARFGDTVTCIHCGSDNVVKRGTTNKGAQRYWCKDCETYFNDLTETVFGHHRFDIEEMFYIVTEMDGKPISQIARDLDRDYEAVRTFVHRVEDDDHDLEWTELCAVERR